MGLLLVAAAVTALARGTAPTAAPAAPSSPITSPAPTVTGEAGVPPLHPSVDGYPEVTVALVDLQRRQVHRVAVKVADTAARRQHGLMEVPVLPEGSGMLFPFDTPRRGGFWMKGTLVPLSIAFAGASGDILAILTMQPCESDPCPVYDPGVAYRWALEVPAGWFAAAGVEEGWRLEIGPVRPAG